MIALGNYDQWYTYLIVNGFYHTVLAQDIVKPHHFIRLDLFDRVVNHIIEENMGKTFSVSSFIKFLCSEHRTVPVKSIYNYLRCLEQAFIIEPLPPLRYSGQSHSQGPREALSVRCGAEILSVGLYPQNAGCRYRAYRISGTESLSYAVFIGKRKNSRRLVREECLCQTIRV